MPRYKYLRRTAPARRRSDLAERLVNEAIWLVALALLAWLCLSIIATSERAHVSPGGPHAAGVSDSAPERWSHF